MKREPKQPIDGEQAPPTGLSWAAVPDSSSRSYGEIPDHSPAQGPFKVIKTDVRADSRGRVTIGPNVVGDTQYRALINELGQIILDPVITVPAREAWLWQNSDALASVVRGVEQAKRGDLGTFPSFAAYADQPDEVDEPDALVKPKTPRARKA